MTRAAPLPCKLAHAVPGTAWSAHAGRPSWHPSGWLSGMTLQRLWWGEATRPAAHPSVVHLCGAVKAPHLNQRHHARPAAAPGAVGAGRGCCRGWRVGGLQGGWASRGRECMAALTARRAGLRAARWLVAVVLTLHYNVPAAALHPVACHATGEAGVTALQPFPYITSRPSRASPLCRWPPGCPGRSQRSARRACALAGRWPRRG